MNSLFTKAYKSLISPCIITHVLQKENASDFIIKRIFRIYPLYFFAVIVESLFNFYINGYGISLSILIPRMLLVGDFFDTPLGLAGVEWTLRIEVLFYCLMGAFKFFKVFERPHITISILFCLQVVLCTINPFPSTDDFHYGYLTLYSVFLFIGVVIYFIDNKEIKLNFGLLIIAIFLYCHLFLIMKISPRWGGIIMRSQV